MIKAVIFDLDGTLLDSLEDLADSVNVTLEALGYPTHELEKYNYFVGDGAKALVYRALPADVRDDDAILEKALDMMREQYTNRWDKKTRPYDGIPQLLDELTSRGIELAVLSNKPHHFTEIVVAKLLEKWNFRFVYGVNDEVPPKPDPTGINSMIDKLGHSKEEILYMGDTATDMKTAKGADLFAIGVLWGFREKEELQQHKADVIIEHPSQTLEQL